MAAVRTCRVQWVVDGEAPASMAEVWSELAKLYIRSKFLIVIKSQEGVWWLAMGVWR
jgi:hypothetical protein